MDRQGESRRELRDLKTRLDIARGEIEKLELQVRHLTERPTAAGSGELRKQRARAEMWRARALMWRERAIGR
jgi:predicted  nucleic acid-binding Zn-ribbon protein